MPPFARGSLVLPSPFVMHCARGTHAVKSCRNPSFNIAPHGVLLAMVSQTVKADARGQRLNHLPAVAAPLVSTERKVHCFRSSLLSVFPLSSRVPSFRTLLSG